MKTIILTGGGTAGHCTPCLALLPYLRKQFSNIYYIGSENGIEKDLVEKERIPYHAIPCTKLKREFALSNLKIPFSLYKSVKKAGKILDKLSPDVIFSKGGYVSLPVVIAAKKRKIPVIAHESDYTVGLANKLSSKFCEKVLTSFPETANELPNGQYVGSPIRDNNSFNKQDLLKNINFESTKPILLIMGGSSGAKAINDCVDQTLKDLTQSFNVIHIRGKNKIKKKKKINGYYQCEFIDDMNALLSMTSVCVARAGSNSLFELLNKKIPTVVIPLPKGSSRGDQILNANYFQKLGLIYVLNQELLTPSSLSFAVNTVYASKDYIKKMLDNYPVKDASEKIVSILRSACR